MSKVGLAEQLLHSRYSPTALVQASYLTAVATRPSLRRGLATSLPLTRIFRGLRKL
jgi:hypothetical protein